MKLSTTDENVWVREGKEDKDKKNRRIKECKINECERVIG